MNEETIPVGEKVLGRVINAAGEPLDDGGAILNAPRVPIRRAGGTTSAAPQPPGVLETGLKVIDLLAPLPRGGVADLFGPAGVGKLVVMAELIHNFATRQNGVAVCAGLEARTYLANEFLAGLADLGVEDKTVAVFWERDEPPTARPRVVLAALTIAEQFRAQGRPVLFFIDKQLELAGELAGVRERLGVPGAAPMTAVLF